MAAKILMCFRFDTTTTTTNNTTTTNINFSLHVLSKNVFGPEKDRLDIRKKPFTPPEVQRRQILESPVSFEVVQERNGHNLPESSALFLPSSDDIFPFRRCLRCSAAYSL